METTECVCGHRFAVKEELEGKEVECPSCGELVFVGFVAEEDDQPDAGETGDSASISTTHRSGTTAKRRSNKETDLGWIFGAVLFTIAAIVDLIVKVNHNRSRDNGSMMWIVVGGTIGMRAVTVFGLLELRAWAKWLALFSVCVTGVVLVWTATLPETPKMAGGLVTLSALSIWGLAGWIILLDRPGSRIKVAVGFIMAATWLTLIYTLPEIVAALRAS